jgi:hypothetical protein
MNRIIAALGAALALVLTGCTTAEDGRETGNTRLLEQLEQFRTPDGLYVAKRLAPVPDLSATSHAARLRGVLRQPSTITLDAEGVRKAFATELESDPLWSRWHLASLSREVGQALTAADRSVIAQLIEPEGFFRDPAAPDGAGADAGIRLMSTTVALEALAATSGGIPADVARRARTWLEGSEASGAAARSASQTLNLARALEATGATLERSMVEEATRPWLAHDTRPAPASEEDVIEAAAAASLIAGTDSPNVDRASLAEMLKRAAVPITDAMIRASVASAVVALAPRTPPAELMAGMPREALDPNGLSLRQVRLVGNLQATYAVIRLRAEAGAGTIDSRLAAALARHEPTPDDVPARIVWCAAMVSVLDEEQSAARANACAATLGEDASRILPHAVTPENMWGIEVLAHAAAVLGIDLGAPELAAGTGPGQQVAEAIWTTSRGEGGKAPRTATWSEVESHLRAGDLRSAVALAAAAHRTSPPSRDAAAAWGAYRASHQGCSNGSLLFARADASTDGCDVYETLHGFRMANLMVQADEERS